MDHVDVVDTREMDSASVQRILHVTIPSSKNCSGHFPSATNLSPPQSSSLQWTLAKPTLDPSCIRFCSLDRWVPDAQVIACMAPGCNVSFSLFNRRHHCRICGHLFCAACSSHTVTVPSPASVALSGRSSPCHGPPKILSRRNTAPGTLPAKPTASPAQTSNASSMSCVLPATTTTTATATATAPTTSTYRICSSCNYEIQLVVARRDENGEVRRKCRGELKMLQWPLLVRMLTYLSRQDILEVSFVSSDFYFMSRDNLIWCHYNMARCKEEELQLKLPLALPSLRRLRSLKRQNQKIVNTDLDGVAADDAAKRVISLHSRYNFTHFLDFARRHEMLRYKGLSSFAVCARMLLSSPVKIAIIGPSGIGKTPMLQHFIGTIPVDGPHATMGFTLYCKRVHLTGGLVSDVMLHIFDISGEPRYEELRRFICSSCHAIGLCYDAQRKATLAEAADVMMGVEPVLSAQPVVLCGIVPPRREHSPPAAHRRPPDALEAPDEGLPPREVKEVHAEGITVRGRGSVQCAWNRSERVFQTLVQCLLDRLSLATSTATGVRMSPEEEKERVANRTAALELLQLTLNPSAIDVLLDSSDR